MKIGNIVSDTPINDERFINYKKIDEVVNDLPTLIVGWKYIDSIYNDYDIINRKLSDKLYWTFSLTERRDLHNKDLYYFREFCFQDYFSHIDYLFINPSWKKEKLIKFYKYCINTNIDVAYLNYNTLYILIKNQIYGIDLYMFNFFGYNKQKILNKVEKKTGIIYTDSSITSDIFKLIDFQKDRKKYIPYIIKNTTN